jgi:DNA-binding beta-propeller fold protein YncE
VLGHGLCLAALLNVVGCAAKSAPSPALKSWAAEAPIILPNQWSLHPAGVSIPLGDLPVSMTLSPDGRYAAVLHSGFGQHEIAVVSLADQKIVYTEKLKNAWLGCAFTHDGKQLLASGGWDDTLHSYDFADGVLSNHKVRVLQKKADKKDPSWHPAGIAISADDKLAYIAAQYGNKLLKVDLLDADEPPTVVHQFKDDHAYPYKVVLDNADTHAWVSLWGGSAVAQVNLADGKMVRMKTDPHPNDMVLQPDGTRLFVACGNTNLADIIDLKSGKVSEKLDAALFPGAPEGSTPNALALDAAGKTLLVANADNNNVAMFDVSARGKSRPLGFIPTGWYPTAVSWSPDGKKILVANGKGNSSAANPDGPQPGVKKKGKRQYIAGLLKGTLSFIPTPGEADLRVYTDVAYACSPLRKDFAPTEEPGSNPIPAKVGDPSPIKYCVYIIKENRTYDQVLGDVKEGNGDPSLCLFPEEVTPNIHKLVRDYVLLDNCYVESEVSCDGHMWSMAAYATDFTEKSWPADYGGHAGYGFKSEGKDPVADPEAGYLWDRAKEAGVTYRSYGEWIDDAGPEGKGRARSKNLRGHFNPYYSAFNMSVSDLHRAKLFTDELDEFSAKGDLPRLIILRLPNDHTSGASKGALTPRAFVAQNDYALGRIVEALSKSPFWNSMAIFVIEDDAQNGPDHVDAHRTTALVIGPHVKRNHVEHTMYSTSSLLRTMELILGMQPMSQFDAAARPMYRCFTNDADATPYAALEPRIDIKERNPDNSPLEEESSKLRLDKEDANDDIAFNQIIWKTVKGVDSEMPAPVRSAAIRPVIGKDDDDD